MMEGRGGHWLQRRNKVIEDVCSTAMPAFYAVIWRVRFLGSHESTAGSAPTESTHRPELRSVRVRDLAPFVAMPEMLLMSSL